MGEKPRIVDAIVSALRFRNASAEKLSSLSNLEWEEALTYADLSHLTLPLGLKWMNCLPEWVRERVNKNLSDNCKRVELIKAAYREIRATFDSANVDHVVLKGFAQCPDYAPDLNIRFQSDIDVYCPEECLSRAADALRGLGYAAIPTGPTADHFPAMVRRGNWEWRGNPYDPEMPPSIELHHRLWNRRMMRFGPCEFEKVWSRRSIRNLDDLTFPALHPVDNLGFSALQVLRDLLNHGLYAHKAYELAYFLHQKSSDQTFWREWNLMHTDDWRKSQAVSFCLAEACFGCDLPQQVKNQIGTVPKTIRAWMTRNAQASLTTHRSTHKDALWVHLSLVHSVRDKLAILFRISPPDPQRVISASRNVPGSSSSSQGFWQYAYYCLKRLPHHAGLIPRALYCGLRTMVQTRRFRNG